MPPREENTLAYIGNAGSRDISVYRLEDGAGLAPLMTVPIPGAGPPGESTPMALSPDRRRLFAGAGDAPFSVWTFALDRAGGLELVGRGALTAAACYIAPHPSGRFLASAAYHAGQVSVNAVAPDGTVGETLHEMTGRANAHCVLFSPSGRHALSASLGDDAVYQDRFDAETGRLAPNDPPARHVRAGAGPRHLGFSPDGRFVYLLCERDASLYVFPFDEETGLLGEATQTASALPDGFSGRPAAADLHLTPDGRLLYASERASSTLAAFRVERDDGRLERVGSYPTPDQPRGFRLDPSGRWLLAAGTKTRSARLFAVDPDSGALTAREDYAAGENANWVEFPNLP